MLTVENKDKNTDNYNFTFDKKIMSIFMSESFYLSGYVNLTENKCAYIDKENYSTTEQINYVNYDEFINNISLAISDESQREDFSKSFSQENLLKFFNEGKNHKSIKYKAHKNNGSNLLYWHEATAIKVDDDSTNDVIIIFTVKDVHSEMFQLEKMGLLLKKERIYKEAINADAAGYFEANLTKDIIIGKIYDYTQSKTTPVEVDPHLGFPISYSKFMQWSIDNVFKTNIKNFILNTDREFLISKFQTGSRTHEINFWTCNSNGQMFFHKMSYYMARDDKTGDVVALCILKDENDTSQKEAELRRNNEIISVLSDEYTTILYVDITNDIVIPYRTTPEFKNFLRTYNLNSKNFTEIMQTYADIIVAEEDRANVKKSLSIDNIRKQLYSKKNFSFIYRSMSIGISRFFEMKFAKMGYGTSFEAFVVGFSNKDVQLRREKERQGRINQKNEIINVLASEYQFVFFINLENDTFTPYNLSGANGQIIASYMKSAKNCYSDMKKLYVDNWVISEDKERMSREADISNIRRQLSDKMIYRCEFRGFNKNYDIHYYEMKIIRVEDKTGPMSAVIGLTDKNDDIRRQTEYNQKLKEARNKAEEANQAKSTFLFNMSHDIRTPMNAILGFTSMAKKYISDTTKVSECLEKVEISGNHLLSLINDILDMARIENNKIVIEETANNLRENMEQIIDILQSSADEKGINLKLCVENLKNEDIYVDALRLNRIIMNIMSNSLKYTKPGGNVTVTVEQKPSEKEGYGNYDLVFADTGIGMSQKFLATIFDSFTREKTSTISGVQGTGLGMAITKNFVELMGGSIDIESELGVGTTVTCHMHFRLQEEEIVEDTESDIEEDIDYSKLRILLVEDNELNREIAKDILEDIGITVEEATDGSVAVDMIRKNPAKYYDLVFMDIQMPYMDGYKATHAIRSIKEEDVASVPIVAMTANAFEEDKQKAYES